MDLLEHRIRLTRIAFSVALGIASGVGVVWAFAQVLASDRSNGPAWFAVFTFAMTFVLVSMGIDALLARRAKCRWHLPIPIARVVRR